MDMWCLVCEIAWPVGERTTCEVCGAEGKRTNLVLTCTASTGFAAEGAEYARAHPLWTRPT